MQPSTTLQFTLPANYEHLVHISTQIDALAEKMTFSADATELRYNLKLAVHEVCNNIIEHAYDGKDGIIHCQLTIDQNGRRFVADLYDSGQEFDPSAVVTPDLCEPQEKGYGLFIVRQLMDEVHYEYTNKQNHWRLVKQW